MGFKSFFKEKKEDYIESREINKGINRRVRNASFEEKEKQAVRFAREKERIKTDQKIKRTREAPSFGSQLGGMLDRVSPPPQRRTSSTVKRKKKKGKRRSSRVNSQQPSIFNSRGGFF